MSYSDFTLDSVARLLGVVTRPADLFPDLRPVPVPRLAEGDVGPRHAGNSSCR